jgi:hypothetical protein
MADTRDACDEVNLPALKRLTSRAMAWRREEGPADAWCASHPPLIGSEPSDRSAGLRSSSTTILNSVTNAIKRPARTRAPRQLSASFAALFEFTGVDPSMMKLVRPRNRIIDVPSFLNLVVAVCRFD